MRGRNVRKDSGKVWRVILRDCGEVLGLLEGAGSQGEIGLEQVAHPGRALDKAKAQDLGLFRATFF